jgi:hypothetical protein
MADEYLVTDGRRDRRFPYTPEGLRDAWDDQQDAPGYLPRQLLNPNRVDLDNPDGLTDDDRERIGDFETERYNAQHADEIASDRDWDQRIDEARGK